MLFQKKSPAKPAPENFKYVGASQLNGEAKAARNSRKILRVLLIIFIACLAVAAIIGFVKYLSGGINSLMSYISPSGATANNQPAAAETVVLQTDNPNININGIQRTIDANNSVPSIQGSSFMAPLRGVAEALGGDVAYNDADKSIHIQISGNSLDLTIGSKSAKVNNIERQYDSAPVIIGGTAMVPIRMISDALSAEITWDAATSSVTLKY